MEVWKSISGFEGFYEVSNLGNVKSLKRIIHSRNQFGKYSIETAESILSPGINNHGYCSVVLQNKSKKTRAVHRLVAEAFIDNPDNLPQVNHKNGIKADNRQSNLEWCDASGNQKHSYRIGLSNPTYGNAKLRPDQVLEIRKLHASGEMNQAQLGRKFKVYKTTIHKIVRNQIWPDLKNHIGK